MIQITRTHAQNIDFQELVKRLDADLARRDGDDNLFYAQFNKLDDIKNVVIIYKNNQPSGCGAFKMFDTRKVEIKRMYVIEDCRRKGYATLILKELEKWANELLYDTCLLETGKRQPEAISLYTRNGYRRIPNYGQYEKVENSCCFEKKITG